MAYQSGDQGRLADPGRARHADLVSLAGAWVKVAYQHLRSVAAALDHTERARDRTPVFGPYAAYELIMCPRAASAHSADCSESRDSTVLSSSTNRRTNDGVLDFCFFEREMASSQLIS